MMNWMASIIPSVISFWITREAVRTVITIFLDSVINIPPICCFWLNFIWAMLASNRLLLISSHFQRCSCVVFCSFASCIVFTGISSFIFNNENQQIWNFATKYNELILILSLIPILPNCFLFNIIENFKSKYENKIIYPIIPFAITSLLWIFYICISVSWTGGV